VHRGLSPHGHGLERARKVAPVLVLRVGRVYDWWICHPDSVGWLRCAARCWYVRYETTAVQPLSCSASWKKCRVVARMLLLILPLLLQKSTKNSSRARENSAFASSSMHVQPAFLRRLGAGP
jgi:hypothetical protein